MSKLVTLLKSINEEKKKKMSNMSSDDLSKGLDSELDSLHYTDKLKPETIVTKLEDAYLYIDGEPESAVTILDLEHKDDQYVIGESTVFNISETDFENDIYPAFMKKTDHNAILDVLEDTVATGPSRNEAIESLKPLIGMTLTIPNLKDVMAEEDDKDRLDTLTNVSYKNGKKELMKYIKDNQDLFSCKVTSIKTSEIKTDAFKVSLDISKLNTDYLAQK